MIDFRTLGTAALEEDIGSSARPIAVQAKRLALVAYMALAGSGRRRRRDTIVALFWPDLDDEHARAALRQALAYLRRTIGATAVLTRGEEEVAIAPEAVRCDAVLFDDAIAAGRLEEAMALYRGDFLDGLFVSDASPELEQWIDAERTRLRHSAATCARSLAESSRRRGDGASAADWGRRAVALAPTDEGTLRWLITLFDSIGNRAGAVEAYERFARRLESEYSAEPSAETKALMSAVRSRLIASGDAPSLTAVPPTHAMPHSADPVAPRDPAPQRTEPSRRNASFLAVAAALALVVALGSAAYRRAERASHTTLAAQSVQNIGADSTQSYLVEHTLGRGRPVEDASLGTARRVDPVALDLYMQGRYWWDKRGPGLLKSISIFKSALDRAPTFALAYSGVADAYVQLGYGSLLRPDDAFPKARAAAERALQLDSTLAEPHATLGLVKMYYDWDWAGAEREFRRALALDSNYATAHEWYGLFLGAMGRFDEAREHEHRAQMLDPLSIAVAGTAAWVLYYAGKFDDAERELRIALRADSNFALGRFYLGRVHQSRGLLDSALAEYHAAGPLRDWVPTIAAVGHVYGSQGRRREALATLARLDSLSRLEYVTPYAVALVHASLGQRDSAFAWLDRGLAERTHWMVWLRRDPRWAPIRADPRFERLARKLRLPE